MRQHPHKRRRQNVSTAQRQLQRIAEHEAAKRGIDPGPHKPEGAGVKISGKSAPFPHVALEITAPGLRESVVLILQSPGMVSDFVRTILGAAYKLWGEDAFGPRLFGACCYCEEEGPDVCNVYPLHFKAPIEGTGWGCVQCDLPPNGALAVLCDKCHQEQREPRFASHGWLAEGRRIPVSQLTEPFWHDESKHEEEDTADEAN